MVVFPEPEPDYALLNRFPDAMVAHRNSYGAAEAAMQARQALIGYDWKRGEYREAISAMEHSEWAWWYLYIAKSPGHCDGERRHAFYQLRDMLGEEDWREARMPPVYRPFEAAPVDP
jgi:hypothetical protein